ncbi:MAG: ABC transporter permease [Bacteroidetes bacterium]|nr:ABC transporter permease [Bacteroidota bacterium]
MLRNYLSICLRNLWKHKSFSAINLVGLALGISCTLFIFLWVKDEKSIDAFHSNSNRLYYVYERNYMGGKLQSWYWTQGPLSEELKKEFPEIEQATAISWSSTSTFSVGEKALKESGYSAGAEFFTMFSHPLLEGSAKQALNTPKSLAISRKMAVDFFGSPSAAIGKTIRYENRKDFTISAVFEDMGDKVSDKASFIMSWMAYTEDGNEWTKNWQAVDPRTVILLRPGANAATLEKKMTHLLDHFETEQKNIRIELALQPFSDYYLHSEFRNGAPTSGRIEYVQLFSIIALFILLIACINFMNLTTARSIRRAKEIGVRKVMGAQRSRLIRQFIGEALLMAFLSVVLALAIVIFLLPLFNGITGKQLAIPFDSPIFWVELIVLILLTGLLSGSYPAFYLSAFNPIRVLKTALPSGTRGNARFRQGLVVFQFVLSIVLILSTFLISRQIDYLQTARLGYDRENLIYIPLDGDLRPKQDVFTASVRNLPGIQDITLMSDNPTTLNSGTLSIRWPGKDPDVNTRFIHAGIGPDFMKVMGLHMSAGRDFSVDFPTDSSGVIINETAAALMGLAGDPIGKTIYSGDYPLHIIGVVKDFHFQSLHEAILPLVLSGQKKNFGMALIRTRPGKTSVALAGLKDICKQLNPAFPFTYMFSDQEYAKLYNGEAIIGRLSVIFAALAIFISCLGLLGLSMFTAEQRIKEIGIRKVLGASVPSLFALLSRSFLGLVGIAFVIAAPLGWWAMHAWLQGYAYRTDIPWWTFAAAGALAAAIALMTVFWQAMAAARANPIRTLRSE